MQAIPPDTRHSWFIRNFVINHGRFTWREIANPTSGCASEHTLLYHFEFYTDSITICYATVLSANPVASRHWVLAVHNLGKQGKQISGVKQDEKVQVTPSTALHIAHHARRVTESQTLDSTYIRCSLCGPHWGCNKAWRCTRSNYHFALPSKYFMFFY